MMDSRSTENIHLIAVFYGKTTPKAPEFVLILKKQINAATFTKMNPCFAHAVKQVCANTAKDNTKNLMEQSLRRLPFDYSTQLL